MMRQQAGFNQPQQIANTLKSRQQSKSMAYAIAAPIFVTYLSIENNVVKYTMHIVQRVMWGKIIVIIVGKLHGLHEIFPHENVGMLTVTHTNEMYTRENHHFPFTISHSVKRISQKFTHYNYTVVKLLLRSRDTKTCSHFLSSDGTNAKL